MTKNFVRVRVVRMNQARIDLNVFTFDYDLTWAAFFLNHHGHVYARYGTRKERDADTMINEEGFKTVMGKVLVAHRRGRNKKPSRIAGGPRYPESFRTLPAKLKTGKNCMHCHQVWDYERKDQGAYDKLQALRVYPLAENLGFSFSVDKGNVVESVDRGGFAAKSGLRVNDEVVEANRTPVYSSADLSWVLHRMKDGDTVSLKVRRRRSPRTIRIKPAGDWRSRNIYWRGSMWAIQPTPGFGGKELNDSELSGVGLKPGSWAIKVRYIVTWGGDSHAAGMSAKRAGLRSGDIVTSVAGKTDFDSELDFQAWYRLNQKAGTTIDLGIIRGGKRQTLKLKVT